MQNGDQGLRSSVENLAPYPSNRILKELGIESITSKKNTVSTPTQRLAKKSSNGKACGSNLLSLKIGDRGIITSPNYPENYPPDSECTWWLKVIRGKQRAIDHELIYIKLLITSDYIKSKSF